MTPRLLWLTALLLALILPARAHDFLRSQVQLRVEPGGVRAEIRVSAVGLGYDLPAVAADGIAAQRELIGRTLARRLVLGGLTPTVEGVAAEDDGQFARVRLRFSCGSPLRALSVQAGALFPNEPTHLTFLSVYGRDGALVRETIVRLSDPALTIDLTGRSAPIAVLKTFLLEGVHHIFLGPDHILFLIGLLLLGGGPRRLAKIVTAFTVAHSITLAAATLGIVDPPARLVEPAIALSIVLVGLHHLASRRTLDLRIVFAFVFGLIHGFGFAGALREMELPRAALGLSLVSFNVGVELGQLCIVLAVAPALAWLERSRPVLARTVTVVLAWGVVLAGAFWFGQRVIG